MIQSDLRCQSRTVKWIYLFMRYAVGFGSHMQVLYLSLCYLLLTPFAIFPIQFSGNYFFLVGPLAKHSIEREVCQAWFGFNTMMCVAEFAASQLFWVLRSVSTFFFRRCFDWSI
jgi:hypothetical protein